MGEVTQFVQHFCIESVDFCKAKNPYECTRSLMVVVGSRSYDASIASISSAWQTREIRVPLRWRLDSASTLIRSGAPLDPWKVRLGGIIPWCILVHKKQPTCYTLKPNSISLFWPFALHLQVSSQAYPFSTKQRDYQPL